MSLKVFYNIIKKDKKIFKVYLNIQSLLTIRKIIQKNKIKIKNNNKNLFLKKNLLKFQSKIRKEKYQKKFKIK